jgi:ectoine hydroxylase-related dioxygenase (phytanoyl-CoA dioxygenase family)
MQTQTSLSTDQLKQYKEQGYVILRGAFTRDEAEQWQEEADRLRASEEYQDPYNLRVGYRTVDGTRILERFDPLRDISPLYAELSADERIVGPLRDIYEDEPKLFKDKLIFKLPGVSGYSMHQDAAWWQGFPIEDLISVMVAVDGAGEENGGLELFPGFHDRFRSTPGELRNMNKEEIAEIDLTTGEIPKTNPGDILIFHSFTPHRSGVNTSDRSRRQLYLTYSPAKHGDLYEAHYEHYHKYSVRNKSDAEKSKHYFR